MKRIIFSLIVQFFYFYSVAQSPIEIIEEKVGTTQMYFYAISSIDEPIEFTFNMALSGATADVKLPISKVLHKGEKTLLTKVTIDPNVEWSYETSSSYKKVRKIVATPTKDMTGDKTTGKTGNADETNRRFTAVQMNTQKINLFTKDGCGRCSFVKEYLDKNKISYVELNTSMHQPNNELMFAELEKAGFTGGSVTMPVVVYKGKLSYSIQNLQAFVETLK